MSSAIRSLSLLALLAAPLAAVPALASTQLGDVVVETDTQWPEADYGADSLTITGGATLSVAGGSRLAIAGDLIVTGSATLLLQGKNTTTQIDNQWQGVGVVIDATNVTVEDGSQISADGQGYAGTAGPGAGMSDPHCGASTAGAGGGFGGMGGNSAFGGTGGGTYGSPAAPIALGSGGGNNPGCNFLGTENAGGGAITLNVTGVLQLDGKISADGAGNIGVRLGGGAGGSLHITTSTLTGGGFLSANGADATSSTAGGGGGGRIAVYYETAPAFSGFARSRADGGDGFQTGQVGTVAFFDTSTPVPSLRLYQNLVFPQDSLLSYEDIVLLNGATLRVGGGSRVDVSGAVLVKERSTILLEGKNRTALIAGQWKGEGVTINAGDVTVENGSTISADGQGYVGAAGPGAGANDLQCGGGSAGAGAGHGGAGGQGYLGAAGGLPYGSPTEPVELGSGGGNNSGCNATATVNTGGGAVRLNVSGVLELDGTIRANAAGAVPERLGGGSGGSIHVITRTLTGAGQFLANGADGGSATAGGGGGGRIAVYYNKAPSFLGFIASRATGGKGVTPGDPGTVAFFETTTQPPSLHVYQNLVFGEDSQIDYEAITLDNGATLRVGGGSTVNVAGTLAIRGNSWLLVKGKNRTRLVAGEWQGEGVGINAGNVLVEAGSTVSADGQGYVGTAGPGAGASDASCGAVSAGAGGGHGGPGGNGQLGALGGSTYGAASAPTELGSGGGNNPGCAFTSTVNAGGGAIALSVSGLLQLDGKITADGASMLPERFGGGAGGSIYVTTTTLMGEGLFSANGAAGGSVSAGGGGGGRIAVYYASGAAYQGAGLSAADGGAGYTPGGSGTVLFVDTVCDADCNGDRRVMVDELVRAVGIALSELPLDACSAADSDGGGTVLIDDLMRAIRRALDGC